MKGSCPVCGAGFDIDAAISDADGRRLMVLLAKLPATVAPVLIQYTGLFRPEKTGMRYSRMYTIVADLAEDIMEQCIKREGRKFYAPHVLWATCMQELLTRPAWVTFPLKKNGLLRKMIADKADKLEAQQEREKEKVVRSGQHREKSKDTRSVQEIIKSHKQEMEQNN